MLEIHRDSNSRSLPPPVKPQVTGNEKDNKRFSENPYKRICGNQREIEGTHFFFRWWLGLLGARKFYLRCTKF